MAELELLMKEVVAFRNARGWESGHTPDSLAKSIMIEAAELLELFQWYPPSREQILADDQMTERIAEELADVLIYALSLADRTGINPSEAIQQKLKKNAKKYPVSEPDS